MSSLSYSKRRVSRDSPTHLNAATHRSRSEAERKYTSIWRRLHSTIAMSSVAPGCSTPVRICRTYASTDNPRDEAERFERKRPAVHDTMNEQTWKIHGYMTHARRGVGRLFRMGLPKRHTWRRRASEQHRLPCTAVIPSAALRHRQKPSGGNATCTTDLNSLSCTRGEVTRLFEISFPTVVITGGARGTRASTAECFIISALRPVWTCPSSEKVRSGVDSNRLSDGSRRERVHDIIIFRFRVSLPERVTCTLDHGGRCPPCDDSGEPSSVCALLLGPRAGFDTREGAILREAC